MRTLFLNEAKESVNNIYSRYYADGQMDMMGKNEIAELHGEIPLYFGIKEFLCLEPIGEQAEKTNNLVGKTILSALQIAAQHRW